MIHPTAAILPNALTPKLAGGRSWLRVLLPVAVLLEAGILFLFLLVLLPRLESLLKNIPGDTSFIQFIIRVRYGFIILTFCALVVVIWAWSKITRKADLQILIGLFFLLLIANGLWVFAVFDAVTRAVYTSAH